jgi:hypothetical protein
MAIQKKSLIGAATAKPKETDGGGTSKPGAEPVELAKPSAARKLAMAKLATAKLSTAKLRTLRKLH